MGSTDTAASSSSSSQIPTIDFSRWNSSSSANQRLAVAKKLTDACHEVGFVCITNHGIDPSLLETAFNWSRKLFDLKHEQNMLAPHPDGPAVHRGYSWPGLEKVSQVISPDGDEGVGEKLREVVDCKVSLASEVKRKELRKRRKATKLEAKRMRKSLTYGCQKISSQASEIS